jgi:hypothetical protein
MHQDCYVACAAADITYILSHDQVYGGKLASVLVCSAGSFYVLCMCI